MLTEFAQGSTILVDKPLHWTSFDAVNKLRWHLRKRLGVKKLKVGHAGTLDPLATGLLVICIGKHTKLIEGHRRRQNLYGNHFAGKNNSFLRSRNRVQRNISNRTHHCRVTGKCSSFFYWSATAGSDNLFCQTSRWETSV